MFHHTTGAARRWVLALSGLASAASLTFAFFVARATLGGWLGRGPWATAHGVSLALLLLAMAFTGAVCGLVAWRGPRRVRAPVVRSGDLLILASLAAVTLFLATFVFGALNAFENGTVRAPLLTKLVVGILAPLGVLTAFGACRVAWSLVRFGRSRLECVDWPRVGGALRASLEIPFLPHRAPAVDVHLELHRSERPSADDVATTTLAWSARSRIESWRPAGTRCASAPIEFALELPVPGDAQAGGVTYAWSLRVEPAEAGIGWSAHFDLPIALEASGATRR